MKKHHHILHSSEKIQMSLIYKLLQIAAKIYYKLRQLNYSKLWQNFTTNCDNYYKLRQNNTKDVNVLWSTWGTSSLYDLFFSCSFIAWHCCWDLFRYLQAFGSNTLDWFVVLPWSSSPDKGIIILSLSPYLCKLLLAVRSRKSLCLMLTKPPFLLLMLCWMSNLLSHGQNVGRFAISQP